MARRRKDEEFDGDAMASQAAFTRTLLDMAQLVHRMERTLERLDDDDMFVRALRLVPPSGDKTEWLFVVTADTPEGSVVAFHSGDTLFDTLRAGLARLENGSLKWREDQYRQ